MQVLPHCTLLGRPKDGGAEFLSDKLLNCIGLGDLELTGHEVGQVGEVHVVGAFGIFPFFLFDGVSLILIINSAEPKQVASRVASVEVKDVPVTNSELSFCWSLRIYIQRLVLVCSGVLIHSSVLLRGSVLFQGSGLFRGSVHLRSSGFLSGSGLLRSSGLLPSSVLLRSIGLLHSSVLLHSVEGWDFLLVIRGS